MPAKYYTPYEYYNESIWILDDTKIVVSNDSFTLRKKGLDGKWNQFGTYEEAEFVLPNFRADSLVEIYSLDCNAIIQKDSDILFQVSVDNGITFLFYNGSIWQTATSLDFSTIEEINQGIGVLPFQNEKSLRFKIKLIPSSDFKFTPILNAFVFYYSVKYNHYEDIKRSFKRFVENNINPLLSCKFKLPSCWLITSFIL